jgi:hypothetical protein
MRILASFSPKFWASCAVLAGGPGFLLFMSWKYGIPLPR